MRGVKKSRGRLERDSGMFLSRLVTSFIRALLRLVVIEIVAKLTKIEQLKKSEPVGNTATEKNLVCICVWLWGGDTFSSNEAILMHYEHKPAVLCRWYISVGCPCCCTCFGSFIILSLASVCVIVLGNG